MYTPCPGAKLLQDAQRLTKHTGCGAFLTDLLRLAQLLRVFSTQGPAVLLHQKQEFVSASAHCVLFEILRASAVNFPSGFRSVL